MVRLHFPGRMKDLANCTSDPVYRTAELCFNLQRIRRELAGLSEVRELVAHEMTHPHTEGLAALALRAAGRRVELRRRIEDEAESLTTSYSRIILPYLP